MVGTLGGRCCSSAYPTELPKWGIIWAKRHVRDGERSGGPFGSFSVVSSLPLQSPGWSRREPPRSGLVEPPTGVTGVGVLLVVVGGCPSRSWCCSSGSWQGRP